MRTCEECLFLHNCCFVCMTYVLDNNISMIKSYPLFVFAILTALQSGKIIHVSVLWLNQYPTLLWTIGDREFCFNLWMDFSFTWNIHMYTEFKYIQTMVKKNPYSYFFLFVWSFFFFFSFFLLSLLIIGRTLTNNSIIIVIISLQHYYFWDNVLFHFHI